MRAGPGNSHRAILERFAKIRCELSIRIPASRIDPLVSGLLKFFPAPQHRNVLSGAKNFIASRDPNARVFKSFAGPIDHAISEEINFFSRIERRDRQEPFGGPGLADPETAVAEAAESGSGIDRVAGFGSTTTVSPTLFSTARVTEDKQFDTRVPMKLRRLRESPQDPTQGILTRQGNRSKTPTPPTARSKTCGRKFSKLSYSRLNTGAA
jgi:hypothetical protein